MNDLELLKTMLKNSNMKFEEDKITYYPRIIIKIKKYNYVKGKNVVITTLDFSKHGKLLDIS